MFVQIDKLICRINHSVRKFQRLHLYAERCIFGLKNRAVFTEFASFLNTAVEIVEEVTSRRIRKKQQLMTAAVWEIIIVAVVGTVARARRGTVAMAMMALP